VTTKRLKFYHPALRGRRRLRSCETTLFRPGGDVVVYGRTSDVPGLFVSTRSAASA